MTAIPVIARELKTSARNRRTYFARLIGPGAALLVIGWLLWMLEGASPGTMVGMLVLRTVSYLVLALCLFTGAVLTSDCISSEKRGDTLGLLFLTQLKARDIVLGKLGATGLRSLLQIAAIVPVVSLVVFLGGISGQELLRVPLSWLSALFLSISMGLLTSTICREARVAMSLCSALVLLFIAGVPSLMDFARTELERPDLALLLSWFSPIHVHESAFSWNYGLSTNQFWQGFITQTLLAVAILALSSLLLPHVWQVRASGPRRLKLKERIRQFFLGKPEARKRYRTKLLARNPIYWLSTRNRLAPVISILVVLAIVGTLLSFGWYHQFDLTFQMVLFFIGLLASDIYLRMRVAGVASHRFAEDRQIGALEMILSTPLAVREVLRGQWRSVIRYVLPSYLVLLFLASLFLYILDLNNSLSSETFHIFLFFVLLSLADAITLGWVAMWNGLRVASPVQAPGYALVRVMILPWLVIAFVSAFCLSNESTRLLLEDALPYSLLAIFLVICGLSNALALSRARRNLLTHFRTAATDRYTLAQNLKWWHFIRPKKTAALQGESRLHVSGNQAQKPWHA